MKKKLLGVLLSAVMAASLAACGGGGTAQTAAVQKAETTAAAAETKAEETKAEETKAEETKAEETKAEETKAEETKAEAAEGDFHIGIVTGSVSQSEDDRRGAEAFQAKYGEDMVTLAIYPDNFTEELETTIQTIVNLSDDPQMKAIIVNQAIPGTTEAFRQIKERRPDIICIAGESHEDLRTFRRSVPQQTWSSTTTLWPAAI